ncbi:MAG: hypothetical protein H8E35_14080 [Ardenticatenia bacterium]|nr:hypothetical protein [Ardenticatenia bacterium]
MNRLHYASCALEQCDAGAEKYAVARLAPIRRVKYNQTGWMIPCEVSYEMDFVCRSSPPCRPAVGMQRWHADAEVGN